MIHTCRGVAATRSPTRRHALCVSSVPSEPKRGINGQKARRPPTTSPAGSSVSIESIASATPIAPIGPSPLVPLTCASNRHGSARMTVAPDANTAGPARRSARGIASTGRLVAAQLLAVARDHEQRVIGPCTEYDHGQDAGLWPLTVTPCLGDRPSAEP